MKNKYSPVVAIITAAVGFFAFISSTNAATVAGAGIEVDGKYVGGYAITRDKESREELIEQFSRHPITFERDYTIPVDAKDPDSAVIRGKIRLLTNIRGDREVMATATSLKLVKRDWKWFVESESLKEALEEAEKSATETAEEK